MSPARDRSQPRRQWSTRVAGLLLLVPASVLTRQVSAAPDPAARFTRIFCAVEADHGARFPYDRPCSEALHITADRAAPAGGAVDLGPARVKLRIVLVPGILGECVAKVATPFEDAIPTVTRLGWRVQTFHVSGRSGSSANAREIAAQLRSLHLAPDEKLVLVGYSKGMSDLLELLGSPDQSLVPSGSSVGSVSGVVRGSPLADRTSAAYHLFRWVPVPGCGPGDGRGVESLTRAYRSAWLKSHRLPEHLHYYSLPAYTDLSNVSWVLKGGWSILSHIDPRNDGQVIASDAVIPGSAILGYPNSDHWAVVLPFALKAPVRSRLFATKNGYPRVVLLESIARFLDEQYVGESQSHPG